MSFTVSGFSTLLRFCDERRRGISVTANNAATDGESDSERGGSREVGSRRDGRRLSLWVALRVDCRGIWTGLEGVVGRSSNPVVVLGGLDGARRRLSLPLLIVELVLD